MPRPLNDSPFLHGLHDPGGEHTMLERNAPGWVVVTVAIGANPTDQGPGDDTRFLADYRALSNRDLGVIVRLNNGYAPHGTLPPERLYDDFARRCANFVRISKGCNLWIVGNEPNHPIEWPGADWDWNASPPRPRSPDREGEKITPERYVRCYRRVRDAIRALPGREKDQVLVAGPAPWNPLTTYPGNPNGDWVQYLADVLRLLGPSNCDGIALHTYTHGTSPSLIRSDVKVGDARFNRYHWHFRAYRDFMAAIPANMRHLPVYITETDQDDPWENRNSGWVREAYREIDEWNRTAGNQQIRSLVLYRWPKLDKWYIEGKQGVIEDFRQAANLRLQWQEGPPAPDLAQIQRDVQALEARLAALQPDLQRVGQQTTQATNLERTVNGLAGQAPAAAAARTQVDNLAQQVAQLEAAVAALAAPPGAVPEPPLDDLRASLPKHPTKSYPPRSLDAIRRVVVHHTGSRSDLSIERIAQYQVNTQKLPGIKYHYVVGADGRIAWTQPLEAATEQTAVPEVNADGVAVALAGIFNSAAPPEPQLAAAAQLIAWLLHSRRLTVDAVVGRIEVDPSDPTRSPGKQWLEGAKYRDKLLAQVSEILAQAQAGQDQVIAQLRRRIQELEARVAELQAQANQLPPLQREVQELRRQVDSQQAELARLRAENSQLLAENARLWAALQNLQGNVVSRPPMVDLVDSLPRHPTLPPYARRTEPIRRIVVHHTDTPLTTTVEQIAAYHVNGERRDNQGNLVKTQWPGIAYHYVITPDGVIHQTQRPETRSYHAGPANNDSLGISLVGRFLRRHWNGTPIPPEQQLPTAAQMRSLSHLIAWLMQEHKITDINQVIGHKEVMDTSCPGDQWNTGANWKATLYAEIQAVQARGGKPLEYCLLFWDHGDAWAETDFRNAQGYIAHFRPPLAFSAEVAKAARHVVIVGGDAGVSGQEEEMLRRAGSQVYRLAGRNEAETKAMLDDLVRKNTPYPGATPPVKPPARRDVASAAAAAPDPWSVPDDWTWEDPSPPHRVKVNLFGPAQPTPQP
ncbi:MAG: N-acetylmuramoyl-L-alanine amidase [Caldilineales bacterium]|nr:N-acetylmuramoyl-L-alanine amidase [Caldilineales bacterium]MDW8318765.1 N-acetylmuramoyl-L-alanine amidase [Anaerolineae bacterium]